MVPTAQHGTARTAQKGAEALGGLNAPLTAVWTPDDYRRLVADLARAQRDAGATAEQHGDAA